MIIIPDKGSVKAQPEPATEPNNEATIMARKLRPAPCAYGCGETPGGYGIFLPGHHQKLRVAIEAHAGGLLSGGARRLNIMTDAQVIVSHDKMRQFMRLAVPAVP